MNIENKDLLLATTKFVAHQCNCTSAGSLGLARSLFLSFPWANTYSKPRVPGTIQVLGDGLSQRFVISLNAQIYPGRPNLTNDTKEIRLELFVKCLEEILKIQNLESIAFPWMIGCGLAGGNWEDYQSLLEVFARKTSAEVLLFRRI
jgi:hypothetical protein